MSPGDPANVFELLTGVSTSCDKVDEPLHLHRKIWISDLLNARASPDGAFFFGQPVFKFKSVRVVGTVLCDGMSQGVADELTTNDLAGLSTSFIIDDSTGVLKVDLDEHQGEGDGAGGTFAPWNLFKQGGCRLLASTSFNKDTKRCDDGKGDFQRLDLIQDDEGSSSEPDKKGAVATKEASEWVQQCRQLLRDGSQGEFVGYLEEVVGMKGKERRLRCTGFQIRKEPAFELVRWFEMMQLYKERYFPSLWNNSDTLARAKRACGVEDHHDQRQVAALRPDNDSPPTLLDACRLAVHNEHFGNGPMMALQIHDKSGAALRVSDFGAIHGPAGARGGLNYVNVGAPVTPVDDGLLREVEKFVARRAAVPGGGFQGVSLADLQERFVGAAGGTVGGGHFGLIQGDVQSGADTKVKADGVGGSIRGGKDGRQIGRSAQVCSSQQLVDALNELMDTGVIYTSKQGGMYFPL